MNLWGQAVYDLLTMDLRSCAETKISTVIKILKMYNGKGGACK